MAVHQADGTPSGKAAFYMIFRQIIGGFGLCTEGVAAIAEIVR